ncbi:MAG: FAD-dependent oxidoreductase, partial [Alphaproteobacteria bacterium]|nr:FAD-dependent oxidoreductase [Alphaproteobacteria bacterium]
MADAFDVIVIGAGPGGYVAAIRAAQLGMSVACVDRRDAPGGTCLNIGCIPSKALLQSSERFAAAQHELAAHGVQVAGVTLDLKTMLARKDKVVADNTRGVEFLFRKNKVEYVKGAARLAARDRVTVALNGGGQRELGATKAIILATGSDSANLPGIVVDEQRIVTSTGALSLASVPKHLVVIGGGYIGLEMGSVWRRLGAEVTVVEFLDRVTPGVDAELSVALQRSLERQGFKFRLGTKVVEAKAGKDGVALALEPAKGGVRESLKADVVLVAVGRVPCTGELGL